MGIGAPAGAGGRRWGRGGAGAGVGVEVGPGIGGLRFMALIGTTPEQRGFPLVSS